MNPAPHPPQPVRLAAAPVAPHQKIERHTVEFTGSGGEYFRVWIVNVLLNVVTLGLYTPFARRRKAQYFYSHTFVADSPLEFIGKQRKMVFGFLAFAGLYVAYEIAVRTGQDTASSLLFFGFALLLPWLWGSAMRFRLASTRWRGVRLAFTASWKEVYLASWPVFAIAAVWTVAFILIDPMMGSASPAAKDAPAFAPKAPELIWPVVAMGAVALVLTLLCVIRLEYNYRRLLVARARIGGQAGRWKPVYGDFVRVWLATVGMFLLCLLAIGLALAAGSALVGRGWGQIEGPIGAILAVLVIGIGVVLMIVLASLPARAYREARMFQLVWNNVGFSHIARSKTDLRTGAYVWLRVRNALLTLLTLGFYRPFAVATEYAAKVGSVTLWIKGGTDQLAGQLVEQQGAFGDAAADALGLDLIG